MILSEKYIFTGMKFRTNYYLKTVKKDGDFTFPFLYKTIGPTEPITHIFWPLPISRPFRLKSYRGGFSLPSGFYFQGS